MYKKLLPVLILALPFIAFAVPFPQTQKGISIVALAKKNMSAQEKEKFLQGKSEEKAKGYKESKNDSYVQFFLNLKNTAPSEIKEFKNTSNVGDSHLKANSSDIKLAFNFKPLNSVVGDKNIIGYAPINTYNEKIPVGWTGIRVFFEEPSVGTCSYSLTHIQAVEFTREETEYLIDNKPTATLIDGNHHTGFIYSVSWDEDGADGVLDSELECANKNMDKRIMDKVIVLANAIDGR